VTTYGVPVRDSQGKIVAVADADISLHWLNGLINEGKAYRSTRRFLVTGSNKLLAGNDNATFRMALKALKADDDQKGYVTLQNKEGEKLHVFFSPIGGKTKWVLLNVVNDSDVFGALRSARLHLQLLVVTILLLLGFIIWRTLHNLERLRKVNAEKNRIAGELRVASQIQQSMLPKEDVRGEGSEKLEVRGFLKPAREVGGDLYGYVIIGDSLYFCLGDVSGKGVPASLFMAQATRLFQTLAKQGLPPADICTRMNDALSGEDNGNMMFVTFFLGLIDLNTGHLSFCNAGHNPPIIGGLPTHGDFLKMAANVPLGLWAGFEFVGEEIDCIKGRPLFIYTDGLNEAEDTQQQQFSDERLLSILRNTHFESSQQVVEHLAEEVEKHRNGAEPNDDLTMMCIRVEE
jgi:serine phosphatase RsbU (regulator of sigma subunit)